MSARTSLTLIAARYIGWERDVVAVEPGRCADLIAARRNLLEDIAVLDNMDVAIMSGQRFE